MCRPTTRSRPSRACRLSSWERLSRFRLRRVTDMARALASGAVLWIGAAVAVAAAPARHVPTVDDLLNTPTVGAAQISPDGSRVAYIVTSANFKEDAFVSQIWVANAATGETL